MYEYGEKYIDDKTQLDVSFKEKLYTLIQRNYYNHV